MIKMIERDNYYLLGFNCKKLFYKELDIFAFILSFFHKNLSASF